MMKIPTFRSALALCLLCCASLRGQNTTQQLVFAGLRSVAQQGQVNAIKTDSAGNLYLLLNQGDGVRLLKTDNAGSAILGQALLGAAGDIGTALALDPGGNVYIAGTTTSTTLTATSGAAIPARTDTSTNSFVAKLNASLSPLFVTFTGGSRIAASAVSATADAVFVAGITYAANLPVTPNGIQQSPAYGSSQNGFVEKFSSSGATLVYATYLTGASGDTTPTAIVADSADNTYVAGETSAPGFPTIAALVPAILSNPSGFLTKLTPAGDGITFSTFIPGAGLASIALDSTGSVLLVSGSVALGQFPVDTVGSPLIPATYQVLLRIPTDGSTVLSSTAIAPATQSSVAAAAAGGAWVDGVLTAPLLPLTPLASLGTGFAVHVPAGTAIDQTARFGGLPDASPSYASFPANLTSVAVDSSGEPIVAGSVQPTASSSLLASETYDLPLRNTPSAALPSSVANAELTAATCTGSLCAGSAAYMAKLNPTASAASLTFSISGMPFIVLRNLGSSAADNLQLFASGAMFTSNCPATLNPGGECDLLLSGGSAGTLTASSSDAASQTVSFPAYSATAPANTIVFYPKELDFGIQTSTSATGMRTVTVTNLGTSTQTFSSAIDATLNPKLATTSPFSEVASDCTISGAITSKVLAAGATCHITLGLTAASTATSDGLLSSNWSIGSHDVLLTGYSQSAALSVSALEIDFGTQFSTGIHLPRYLYLSNASSAPIAHAAVSLAAGSAFTLTDACPSTLLAGTVCRIRIDYLAAKSTSTDSVTLALDQGLSVLVTGKTLPPAQVGGATANPNLSVTPAAATFANAVAVTALSGSTQTVTIANTGSAAFALALSLTGDFTDVTGCGATLAGGASCTAVVTFAPSQPGTRQGLLAVTAGSGTSPAYAALSGTGSAILPANNGTLASGSVAVGQPSVIFYKIQQPFTAMTAVATGPFTVLLVEDAGFGPGQPATTSYAATYTGSCHNCYLGVQYTPTATGVQTGTLILTSVAGGSPYLLSLTGTGLPTTGLLLTPMAQDFGTVPVHSVSGTQFFTLTNLTSAQTAVTLSAPSLTGDFTLAAAVPGATACSGALAYTASCMVAVAFTPTATGSRTGSITFAAGATSVSATLTGLATADPGIAINPLALSFNSVPGSTETVQTVTLTNTGSATLQIGPVSVATSSFKPATTCGSLAAGASCSIAVTFLSSTATVTDTLSIPVAGTTYTVTLAGDYTAASSGLEIVPGSALYGPVPVETEGSTRLFTVNNLTAKAMTLNIVIPRQFVLTGAPCGGLAPNASCSFSLAFLPLTNGSISGTIAVQGTPTDGSAGTATIGYAEGFGIGAGTLTVTGALIVNHVFAFGQVTSGQTQSQTFTLANNNASGAITIRRITSGPPFLSTNTCGTALVPSQSCTVTVTYTPTNQVATGTASPVSTSDAGSLIIESDAASSTDIVNLTGQAGPIAVANPTDAATLATFTLSQSSLAFPTTTVGDVSAPQSITLANTGTVTIHVRSVFFTSPDFNGQSTCAAVVPGATCTISVTTSPIAAGLRFASLEIATDASTGLEFVSLVTTGAPSQLTLSAATLNFGPILVGSSAALPVQVTNSGASAITFTGITATGDYAVAGGCPFAGGVLAPGFTCMVQVTFHPQAAGTRAGLLGLASSASTNPLTVALTGIGTQPELTIAPSSLVFGNVTVGSSANLSVTLLNNGTTSITNLAFAAKGDFAVTSACPTPTLLAGASCAVQITFSPTAVGSRTGSLTVTSSDPGSPAIIALSGVGLQGGGFTLAAASASATVVSGQPATYQLTLAPTGGFTGPVALTCTPIAAAQYATCSLLPSSVLLNGSAQPSVVTINTITSTGGNAELIMPGRTLHTTLLCLMFPGLLMLWRGRRELRRHRPLLLALVLTAVSVLAVGCGGGSSSASGTLYTPPGFYQYQVTASSTSGVAVAQSVTLSLTVTAR